MFPMTAPDPSASVRLVRVAPEYANQRIDNYLLRILKGVPKSLIYRLLRKGQVRVNRRRTRPDYRLQPDDTVRIPPLRLADRDQPAHLPPRVLATLEQAILREDAELLILNKPAGIAVHKGSGLDFGVIEALRVLRPRAPFLELAHRLDRDTSGCLVLAKTPLALRSIHGDLKSGAVDKRYLALVKGSWDQDELEVSLPLAKVLRGGERMITVNAQGKPALTRFKVISRFHGATLLEAAIATGRTHQIRVHAAYLGHPVAGDAKYGDTPFNREMARHGLRRLFLHAGSIAFDLDGRRIAASAPLDQHLKQVTERLASRDIRIDGLPIIPPPW